MQKLWPCDGKTNEHMNECTYERMEKRKLYTPTYFVCRGYNYHQVFWSKSGNIVSNWWRQPSIHYAISSYPNSCKPLPCARSKQGHIDFWVGLPVNLTTLSEVCYAISSYTDAGTLTKVAVCLSLFLISCNTWKFLSTCKSRVCYSNNNTM